MFMTRIQNNIKNRKERGMASLLYIFLITVIAGYLGYAMDSALGNYTANGLKNAVDSATLAASGNTVYSGNKQSINKSKAKTTFKRLYGANRKNYPNVTARGNYTLSTFKVTKSRGGGANNTLTVMVKEKSNTRFLALLGTKQFNYNIKSTARLGALYEK